MDTRRTRKAPAKHPIVVAPGASCDGDDAAADAGRRLERALARIEDLADQLFVLQEQNQQLRSDLARHVCPRLCNKPYRSAS